MNGLGLGILLAGLVSLAVFTSYGFAWYSWRRASHPVSDRFALLMVADGSWALFALFELVSPTDALSAMWTTPIALVSALSAVFWFLFVLEYTGYSDLVPRPVEYLLVGEAVLYGALHGLNPGDLMYTEITVTRLGPVRLAAETFGPGIELQIILVYAILCLTFLLLGRFFVQTRNLYRKQTGIILGVTLSVLAANVAFIGGLRPYPGLDLTPVFFVVQAVGVGIALYRYDFLSVAPLAANTLLEEMADPVYVVDTDGRLLDWNRAASLHISDADGDLSISDIDIPDLGSRLAADGGTAPGLTQVTTTRTDGDVTTEVVYDVRTTDIPDRYGVLRGRAIVLRDVTDQVRRKQALETQNERLEEFTGVVSHDLRNPLQLIDGKITLAQQTGNLDHLSDASDAVDRMERMLDELLTLAREGQTIAETEPVALPECCRTAWDGVATDDATLVVDTDRTVEADTARLQRLLENLFRNAADHAGPDVTVTVGDTTEGFYVADDGPGIPADQRDSVFEFGTTFSADGTGFGLAIVESIAEAHGWSITVGDSESGGARFDISVNGHDHLSLDESALGDEP